MIPECKYCTYFETENEETEKNQFRLEDNESIKETSDYFKINQFKECGT